MLPLLFVIIVTGVKQLYEDILRHKNDREINNSKIRILRDGQFKDFLWKDIVVS
jgi:phospholipid-translocating ATPase